jgi:hypothetical protein
MVFFHQSDLVKKCKLGGGSRNGFASDEPPEPVDWGRHALAAIRRVRDYSLATETR